MNLLNPTAFTFWLFGTALGGAIAGSHGALVGLAITTGIVSVRDLFVNWGGL